MVAAYYLDTSALVKQYVDETGSAWIRDLVAAVHLASALAMHRPLVQADQPGLTFLCADDRLLDAAKTQGLTVDHPDRHEKPIG